MVIEFGGGHLGSTQLYWDYDKLHYIIWIGDFLPTIPYHTILMGRTEFLPTSPTSRPRISGLDKKYWLFFKFLA